MTKAEAKRRVCDGAAKLLDSGHDNPWLYTDGNGNPLSDADAVRMAEAFEELCAELRRRGGR